MNKVQTPYDETSGISATKGQEQQSPRKIDDTSSNVELNILVQQQKFKQLFLEKKISENMEEFTKFNNQMNGLKLNDVEIQQYESQWRNYLKFLKEELKIAQHFQEPSNYSPIDKVRLKNEKIETYYQLILLKEEKMLALLKNPPQLKQKKKKTRKLIRFSLGVLIFCFVYGSIQSNQKQATEQIYQLNEQNQNFSTQLTQLTSDLEEKDKEIFKLENEVTDLQKKNLQYWLEFQELKNEFQLFRKQFEKNKSNHYNYLVGEIFQNMKTDSLKDFSIIYNKYYSQPVSNIVFDKLSKQLFQNGKDPLVCIGSVKSNDLSELILVGCDLASEIFQETYSSTQARLSKNGPIYWYWVENKSFGFAPTSQISLNSCDQHDPNNNLRLSYWNDGKLGGRRIGKLQNIIDSDQYKLVIYALI